MKKIAFIGAGQMAQAIISGLDKESLEIVISGRDLEKTKRTAQELGVSYAESNSEAAAAAEYVVLAVKPIVAPSVLEEIGGQLSTEKVLVSIASGLTLADLAEMTSSKLEIIRVMPNVNAKVHLSTSAIVANSETLAAHYDAVKSIFEQIGSVKPVAEKDFPTFGAIAGSSPAFIYSFIDALATAGVKYGLSKKDALEIVAETVKGSAELVLESNAHPRALADSVASPGGTTIEGLIALDKGAFAGTVISAVEATIEKEKGGK